MTLLNVIGQLDRLTEAPEHELHITKYHWSSSDWNVTLEIKAKGVKVKIEGEGPTLEEAVFMCYDRFMNLGDIVERDLHSPMIEPPKPERDWVPSAPPITDDDNIPF